MQLLRAGVLNSIAVLVRVASGVLLNKMLALFVGPSGYALIGQFQNFVSIGTAVASAGVGTGVTKYTAEHTANEGVQQAYWRTAVFLTTCCTLIVCVLSLCLRDRLALELLKDGAYSDVFIWYSGALIFAVWSVLLLAILNGRQDTNKFFAANVIGSLAGLGGAAGLVAIAGLRGALVALVAGQAIVFVAIVILCWRESWFRVSNFFGKYEYLLAKKLSAFALMAIASAVVVPGSQLIIRDHLVETFGLNAAGYWQAMTKVSDLYLMVVTTTLSYYYLPRLARMKVGSELRAELVSGYRYFFPVAVILALLIYLFRGPITHLLFAETFEPMETLFFWQMLGDVMKIGSWLVGFVMLAKAMTKRYIVTEVVFSATLIGLTMLFTGYFGVEGAVMAFALNYLMYWLVIWFVCADAYTEPEGLK